MGAVERFFERFVAALTDAGAGHVFLRGHASFPSVPEGSDVDMLVDPSDRARVEAAFHRVAADEGFHVWQRSRSGFITRLFAYAADGDAHAFFDLDIHTSEASYGIPYLTAEELLPHALVDGRLRRLPPPIEALVNALGEFFQGGRISDKSARRWSECVADPAAVALATRVLGEADGRALLEAVARGGDDEGLRRGRQVGARVRRRMLARRPLRSAAGFAAFGFGERVRPWFAPRGRFIIFAGTDGSGKTTLAAALREAIAARFRDGVVEEHHLRPGILPQLSALFHGGKPAYGLEDMADPHRAEPSGPVGSALRTLYYWVDYLLGYPLRILPLRRRNSLIIYDRWFYDHVVDPRRFRIAPGHPLPGLLQHLLAKPDRLLVCTAGVDRILERKQELAPEEVARQVAQFQAFASKHPRATVIDTSGELGACVNQAVRAVFGGTET